MNGPALVVEDLRVAYGNEAQRREVLRDIRLSIEPGQSYGLVGESGSGKSTLALAIMRQLNGSGSVISGRIEFAGLDLLNLGDAELRRVWRERIKFVPQDPGSSLNPGMKVGKQIEEAIDLPGRRRQGKVLDLLAEVGLSDPERVADSYPHRLSGGMQQRVMIAMALTGKPELLILDEPTTNLDVTTQATILDLIKNSMRVHGTAVLYVSHSLGVVAQLCERVAVLYAGELVEDASADDLYRQPLHPYTRGLLDSVPVIDSVRASDIDAVDHVGSIDDVASVPVENGARRNRELRPIAGRAPDASDLPDGCVFAPRCPLATDFTRENRPSLDAPSPSRRVRCHRWQEIAEGSVDPHQPEPIAAAEGPTGVPVPSERVLEVDSLEKSFPVRRNLAEVMSRRKPRAIPAVSGVDLHIRAGRTLGLVGESGSGKSTLARCVVGLVSPSAGSVRLFGSPLAADLANRDDESLRRLQMVFQNADEALNPYRTVGDSLRRPLKRLAGVADDQVEERVQELLAAVNLSSDYSGRLPGELSGGEKQRLAIARAFASHPDLLLFDESVSGLDVSVQAVILNLLRQLQLERQSAYLFISHDLAVVSYLADEIAVIYRGRLVETGPAEAVLRPPHHPYTEALLSAVPVPDPTVRENRIRLDEREELLGGISTGCPFHSRCRRSIGKTCAAEEPSWQVHESGKRIYCHIPLEELEREQAR